jgi:radical SAM-linked protein
VQQRWAIWLAIEGDLRFLSHHETMRAVEYAVTRANLPLRYSQGFNPHPVLALLPPRPVGVASMGDLLVMSLEQPQEQAAGGNGPQAVCSSRAGGLVASMQAAAPRGMRFLRAVPLSGKTAPRPLAVRYELPLKQQELAPVNRRLEELAGEDRWIVSRLITPKKARFGRAMQPRDIDIKPMVADLRLEADKLRWSAVAHGDAWARPGEVLRLLGLDERVNLAAVERIAVEYDFAP